MELLCFGDFFGLFGWKGVRNYFRKHGRRVLIVRGGTLILLPPFEH